MNVFSPPPCLLRFTIGDPGPKLHHPSLPPPLENPGYGPECTWVTLPSLLVAWINYGIIFWLGPPRWL